MKRRERAGDGLRQLLIDDRQHRLDEWNNRDHPGWPVDRAPMRDQLLEALKSGGPVEVGSADLMCALMHAGLDARRFAFGGADWSKLFVLDEQDRLLELPG